MSTLREDIDRAFDSVEQQAQDVCFHQPHATHCEQKLANALLVLLSIVRLSHTEGERSAT